MHTAKVGRCADFPRTFFISFTIFSIILNFHKKLHFPLETQLSLRYNKQVYAKIKRHTEHLSI